MRKWADILNGDPRSAAAYLIFLVDTETHVLENWLRAVSLKEAAVKSPRHSSQVGQARSVTAVM